MNRYESIFIITNKWTTPDKPKEIFEKYKNDIKRDTLVIEESTHFEGLKALAYECKGCKEGYFCIITFDGTPEFVSNLERAFRIDDNIIKFIITRLNIDDETPFTPPAKVNNSAVDAMDVLLGLDSYAQPDDVAPDAKSEQSSDGENDPDTVSDTLDKPQVYVLSHQWEWDGEKNTIIEIYATWEKALKKFKELKEHEKGEFKKFDKDSIEESEFIKDVSKDFARFSIWNNNDGSYESFIKIEKQEVK